MKTLHIQWITMLALVFMLTGCPFNKDRCLVPKSYYQDNPEYFKLNPESKTLGLNRYRDC